MPSLLTLPHATEIAGVDEAGRGCLAGPVVAAAVILPDDSIIDGLTDSKQLAADEREALVSPIKELCVAWSIGLAWPWEVDEINILQATFRAMAKAVNTLKSPVRMLQVDGNHSIPKELLQQTSMQEAIIGGDAKIPAISAASILAKTWRDKLMLALDSRYPNYGFAAHKGYGTKMHLAAIQKFGSCRMHRLSFKGVRVEKKHTEQQQCLPGL